MTIVFTITVNCSSKLSYGELILYYSYVSLSYLYVTIYGLNLNQFFFIVFEDLYGNLYREVMY